MRLVREIATSQRSSDLLQRARLSIAGGDSSSMRVLPYHLPLVAARGCGARVWDVDGNEYVDLNMAYGPLIFGHAPSEIARAVTAQITERGSQLGFPTEITVRVAEKLRRLFPAMQRLRFANSGTEAAASAARLARAATGRQKLILFEGHYHGWSEALFARYHAPLEALSPAGFGPALPGTAGMTRGLEDVVVVRWNDLEALGAALDAHRGAVAGVVMEPVMGNAGVIPPRPGFLLGARELAHQHGALLVLDEVITGMRVAAGGAQERYEVDADITTVSKALGGGYPVAAFGASEEIMSVIADGTLFHGGVFAGNAVVMAAAEAVLDAVLARREVMYRALEEQTRTLAHGMREVMNGLGVPHVVQHVGPMLSLFLTETWQRSLHDYRDVRRHGAFDRYIAFQHEAQRGGVYFHPNMFEPMYLSTAHGHADVARALDVMETAASRALR